MNFSERTIMVTGAAGNLGRVVAAAFTDRGANLVLVAIHREQLERLFGAENERRLFLPANLLQQDETDRAVKTALDRFGRIDVLCNIAGGFRMGNAVHETSDEIWNFLVDVNVRTLLHAVRAVVPRMLEHGGGKIVNVGAFAAQKGVAQMGAYCAAKSAVIRLPARRCHAGSTSGSTFMLFDHFLSSARLAPSAVTRCATHGDARLTRLRRARPRRRP